MKNWQRNSLFLALSLTAAITLSGLTSADNLPAESPASTTSASPFTLSAALCELPAISTQPSSEPSGQVSAQSSVQPSAQPVAPASAQPTPLPQLSDKAWLYISKKSQRIYLKDVDTRVANKPDKTLANWPVSTARYSASTPVGRFKVVSKFENPPYSGRHGYYPAKHPKNPLGSRWMALNVGHFRTGVTIGIHGTNEPDKVGQAVSDGCVRLRNPDVETLFKLVKVGMPVVISNQ